MVFWRALWAVPLLGLGLWALSEPHAGQAERAHIHCEQGGQKKIDVHGPNALVLVCDRIEAKDQEFPAYTAVKSGQFDELPAALRHWLYGVFSDPIAAFTLILAASTIGLWFSTRRLWRGAEAQARDFKKSVEEATRSAAAMEGVDRSMAANAEQIVQSVAISRDIAESQRKFGEAQMRARISVLIGGAIFQDRKTNKRFEADPVLLNTGNTHALRVRYRIMTAVLPVPVPENFKFPLPPANQGSTILGPGRDGSMSSVIFEYFDDAEVDEIKLGSSRSLYVWGTVQYYDIFKKLHRLTFAQQIYWQKSGLETQNWEFPEIVRGYHLGKHNRAN